MKLIVGACLLAVVFTITECDIMCDDFTNHSSQLYMCFIKFAADPPSVCGENCEDILREYGEMCPSTGAYTNALNNVCSNGGTPNVPATVPPESPMCTNTSSDLYTCHANLATNPSTACSSDCRSALKEYVDECLSGTPS